VAAPVRVPPVHLRGPLRGASFTSQFFPKTGTCLSRLFKTSNLSCNSSNFRACSPSVISAGTGGSSTGGRNSPSTLYLSRSCWLALLSCSSTSGSSVGGRSGGGLTGLAGFSAHPPSPSAVGRQGVNGACSPICHQQMVLRISEHCKRMDKPGCEAPDGSAIWIDRNQIRITD
jgi:hypothetical protein